MLALHSATDADLLAKLNQATAQSFADLDALSAAQAKIRALEAKLTAIDDEVARHASKPADSAHSPLGRALAHWPGAKGGMEPFGGYWPAP